MPILPEQSSQRDIDNENYGETGHPKHSTYYNKPTPAFQLVSQSSQFNDQTRASLAYGDHRDVIHNPDSIPAVPTTWDTFYDPSHPDADWSGLVNKSHIQKKHIHGHSSLEENIVRSEHGIVSKHERQEFARRRAPEDPSIARRNVMGSIVISGIDDPDDRYKTTHQRFENREPTSREQLILDKRTNPIKKISDPAQSQSHIGTYGAPSPRFDTGKFSGSSTQSQTLQTFSGRGSLLSGIADKLAPSMEMKGRFDSFQKTPSSYESNKLLVVDNYKNFVPGYTGARKF